MTNPNWSISDHVSVPLNKRTNYIILNFEHHVDTILLRLRWERERMGHLHQACHCQKKMQHTKTAPDMPGVLPEQGGGHQPQIVVRNPPVPQLHSERDCSGDRLRQRAWVHDTATWGRTRCHEVATQPGISLAPWCMEWITRIEWWRSRRFQSLNGLTPGYTTYAYTYIHILYIIDITYINIWTVAQRLRTSSSTARWRRTRTGRCCCRWDSLRDWQLGRPQRHQWVVGLKPFSLFPPAESAQAGQRSTCAWKRELRDMIAHEIIPSGHDLSDSLNSSGATLMQKSIDMADFSRVNSKQYAIDPASINVTWWESLFRSEWDPNGSCKALNGGLKSIGPFVKFVGCVAISADSVPFIGSLIEPETPELCMYLEMDE